MLSVMLTPVYQSDSKSPAMLSVQVDFIFKTLGHSLKRN